MGILGPFLKATGQYKFIFVVVDYFIWWVKAKVVASITEREVHKSIWKNIIIGFEIPRVMVFDNGQQFNTYKV